MEGDRRVAIEDHQYFHVGDGMIYIDINEAEGIQTDEGMLLVERGKRAVSTNSIWKNKNRPTVEIRHNTLKYLQFC